MKAWRSPRSPTDRWPEDDFMPESVSLGICLSGGGSRAYTAAMGSLRALHDMGVLGKAKYLSGVSGGGWATSVYTYVQSSEDELSDEAFLGTLWEPEDTTFANLSVLDEHSVRYSPTRPFDTIFAEEAAYAVVNPFEGLDEVWERAVHRTFLEPHGIERSSFFSWNSATRDETISRNPSLADEKWLVPQRRRPYPILVTTVIGPTKYQPQAADDFLFTQSEVTPLYAGVAYDYNATYKNRRSGLESTVPLGGLVEPIGYDSRGVVSSGLDPSSAQGLLTVQAPPGREFTWARGASQSSLAPGAYLSMKLPLIGRAVIDQISYWPPSSLEPAAQDVEIGDGGDSENSGIYPLLRRRVERIVMVYNPPVAVSRREDWDPMARDPVLGEISDAFACLWGIYVNPGEYNNTIVFPRDTFPGIAAALQDSQASGKGAVTTVELTTVENERFGIPAGITTRLTILYLAASTAWEDRLPADVRAALRTKTFPGFPFYPTSDLSLSAEKVNLLATLTGWTAKANVNEFQDIVGGDDIVV